MVWTPPRRVTSAPTTVSVATNDGTSFVTSPSTYKGNQQFTALAAVRDSINATTGGFATLPNTKVATVFSPGSVLLQTGHYGSLGGTTGIGSIYSVWGGGAWTGYGFFVGSCGMHNAWHGNDIYMIQVVDGPSGQAPASYRIHDPAPLGAAVSRTTMTLNGTSYVSGQILKRSDWYATSDVFAMDGVSSWGPAASHTYDGWAWDAANEQIIFGGDGQHVVTNMTEELATIQREWVIWRFNVNASTPKSAWLKTVVSTLSGSGFNADGFGVYAVVDNADGTFSFRTRSKARTFNPVTGVTAISAANVPPAELYSFWDSVTRDPITNKYYEIRHQAAYYGEPNVPYRIYELNPTTGARTARAALPTASPWTSSTDSDNHPGIVIRNGIAYLWPAAPNVIRADLTTGAIQEYAGAASIARDANTGVWGRWAYEPNTGVFVGISSKDQDVWVFRPPAAWGSV